MLASWRERFALRVVQTGAIAAVLAVAVLHTFELDRFFVPKELTLHLTAFSAALLLVPNLARVEFGRVDRLLFLFFVLSAIATIFATNIWLALRALAISGSALLIFWSARALSAAGLGRRLVNAIALAVVLTAVTALLQTYGISSDFFSENRAPGGTLGNRNFVAHVAAFGWPMLLLVALSARTRSAFFIAAAGSSMVIATLVLTRSRGAWLAFATAATLFLLAVIMSRPLRRGRVLWWRLVGIILLSGIGVGLALALPNSLRWRSDNPYLESVQRMTDYQEGSGRGRLIQYERSLAMAVRHPLLGVGPGNWPVEYPAHAARRDPSLDESNPGMTSNPWPSSDWVAFVAERGFTAAAILLLVIGSMALAAARDVISAVDYERALSASALIASLAAVILAGAFDAVLLLPLPALLAFASAGALLPTETIPVRARARWIVIALLLAVAASGTARSALQITGMQLYANARSRESLLRAAEIDPGNYRVQIRLASGGARKERCRHALAARALFPNAVAAMSASRGCR